MDSIERERRMRLCQTTDDWNRLYFDVFQEEPDFAGDNWGQFQMEKMIDAIFYNKPIRQPSLPADIVL